MTDAVTVQLDDFVFTGFEVPEAIPFGCEQALKVTDLPGGLRDIVAMGGFDDDITWTGRFRGANAPQRAQYLKYICKRGTQVLLTWGDFVYWVFVKSFKPVHQSVWEIPYTLTLTVLSDRTWQVTAAPPSSDQAISTDINDVLGLGAGLSLSTVTAALSAVSTAYGVYKAVKSGNLNGLSVAQIGALAQTGLGITSTTLGVAETMTSDGALSELSSTIADARSAVKTTMAPLNALIKLGEGGIAAGGTSPLTIGTTLLAQASAFQQLDGLSGIGSRLDRMATNVSSILG